MQESVKPIKCAAKEYAESPFYLIETNGSARRFVIYIQDRELLRSFLFSFIDSGEEILLVRIRDFEDREDPIDYDGQTSQLRLKTTIDSFADTFFHDGFHSFMIRQPEKGDYLAFEEHGLIYLYTDTDYSIILDAFALRYAPEASLITHFNHWHYRPAHAAEDLHSIIGELGLEAHTY